MLRLLFAALLFLPPLLPAAEKFGPYAEPDFPVLTSTVDFSDWGKQGFPKNNVAVRGLIIKLPHDLYVCFDQDLLRVAGIWQGEPGGKFLTYTTIPAISYNIENKKSEPGQKDLPKPIGKPLAASPLIPGVFPNIIRQFAEGDLADPRPPGPDPAEPGRGPLPDSWPQWFGWNVKENAVVLTIHHKGAPVYQQFSSAIIDGKAVVRRNIYGTPNGVPLTFVVGQAKTESGSSLSKLTMMTLAQGESRFVYYAENGALPSEEELKSKTFGSPRWNRARYMESVKVKIQRGREDGAFAVDTIPLPVPNLSNRNVRPSGICAVKEGDSSALAICTIDGDVWAATGVESPEGEVEWRRIATGLHEPQSICMGTMYFTVFTRDGIVVLFDSRKVPAAGCINFCNRFTQTGETREYPMDMVAKPGGGFYISKGGQMITRKTPQGGHVLEISADGKTVTDICSGLRQPYLGIHPKTGLLTASDQQGHWTVATPIRYIRKGAYYGFEEAAPNPIPSLIDPPACWIPHEVNQSAAGQVWAVDAKMGPLNERLLHLMYYRPGILTAFLDPDKTQAAIAPTGLEFDFPLLKGAINPVDGLLYVCGFRIWGTESKNMAGVARVRPTGRPSAIPTEVRAVPQGIHLRFGQKLDAASLKPEHFAASRWNYKRTSGYGSAHYKLDGKPGMEPLPCVGAQLSADGMGVLVHLPDMKPAEQYRLDWRLTSAAGTPVNSFTTLTLYELKPFDAAAAGFDASFKPAPPPVIAAAAKEEPTMETGKLLITNLGCLACHSTDGKMEGMKGPTWKDLFGSENELVNGKKVTADAVYLRESILKPAAKVRKGFNNPDVGMPPYEGILNDSQVDSIVLYLRTLSQR